MCEIKSIEVGQAGDHEWTLFEQIWCEIKSPQIALIPCMSVHAWDQYLSVELTHGFNKSSVGLTCGVSLVTYHPDFPSRD